jgi:pSer/pThr/pTyr-binding forkhead associated (FHA) protein
MKAPFFVEVLARNGEVRQRQRVEALPIRIGRGYDNDFILDDRHTSANHVIVELNESGSLDVHDLGSRNGLVFKGKRLNRLSIDGNTVFRLGHTNLRVRSADYSVDGELRDTTSHGWEGWPPALTGLVLLVLLSLTLTWLSDTEKAESIRYITSLAGMLSAVFLWCGGWTLANRLFAGQTRFGRHLFIAGSGLVAIELASFAMAMAAYAFSLETLSGYGSHVVFAIAAGMVFFHLATINPNNTKRFAIASIILLILGSAVTLIFNYQNRGHLADELYLHDLFSPALRVSSNKTIEQFIAESRQLKAKVDAERGKKLHDGGDEGGDGD